MTYTTQNGDQWDMIAKTVYGDELKADILLEANLSYADIFQFDYGTQLNCPDITNEQAAGLPPWRK